MKIIILVVCALAVVQAALNDVFYSQPMATNKLTETSDNLDDGTFITRLDHTRPTDIRTVQFVSKISMFSRPYVRIRNMKLNNNSFVIN